MKNYISLFMVAGMLFMSCGQGNNNNSSTAASGSTVATAPASNGRQLFMNNCARCHGLKEDKMGPKLDGVFARWNNDSVKVAEFVKNSQQVINGGQNAYAINLYHTWNNMPMPSFNLKDDEIKDILSYIHAGIE